jgi:hypothetical protein
MSHKESHRKFRRRRKSGSRIRKMRKKLRARKK